MPKKTNAPSRPGVKNGLPRARSYTKNHTATTAAPIRPATMPSRKTERGSPAMAVFARMVAPSGYGAAREPDAVVRVPSGRRQRRTMADRAPRVRVSPGTAAADPSRAAWRPRGVGGRGARVILVVVPVGAPFVAHAREVEQPQWIRRRGAHPRRLREALRGRLARPRQARAIAAAARGLLPLGLARQSRARPRGERGGVVPRHADDALLRIVEARLM